jgi:hypothetical protein
MLAEGNIEIPVQKLDFMCRKVKQIFVTVLNVGVC